MSWEEIDADRHGSGKPRTYYGVAIGEDHSFAPDALFSSEDDAHAWVAWQRGLWTEEKEEGICPGAETFVMPVRSLEGRIWDSCDPVPSDGA